MKSKTRSIAAVLAVFSLAAATIPAVSQAIPIPPSEGHCSHC